MRVPHLRLGFRWASTPRSFVHRRCMRLNRAAAMPTSVNTSPLTFGGARRSIRESCSMRGLAAVTGVSSSTPKKIIGCCRRFMMRSIRTRQTLATQICASCSNPTATFSRSIRISRRTNIMGFASISPLSVSDVPADIDAALSQPDWRNRLMWPVSLREAQSISTEQTRDALAFAGRIGDASLRDVVLLALPTILAYARAIVLAALAVDRAARGKIRLIGSAPELDYLRTGEQLPAGREELILPPIKIGLPLARRIARVHSWSGFSRLFRAVTRPDILAVGHNELLCAAAARETRAVGFQYPEVILGLRRLGMAVDFSDTVSEFAAAMLGNVAFNEPYRSRACDLLQAVVGVQLRKSADD